MIKRIMCLLLGHKYDCRWHNFMTYHLRVDKINVCVVRCIRCFGELEHYMHYSENCEKKMTNKVIKLINKPINAFILGYLIGYVYRMC